MHVASIEGGTLTLELSQSNLSRMLIVESDNSAMQRWEANITKALRTTAETQPKVFPFNLRCKFAVTHVRRLCLLATMLLLNAISTL